LWQHLAVLVAESPEPEPESEAEFDYDRTVALSDGVFAIALTLLVLTIAVPDLQGAAKNQLADKLSDQLPQLLSYAVSFAVLSLMWVRHHGLFRKLTRITFPITVLNLAYLAVIAFLPYPTSLIGRYGGQPVSVVVYAVTIIVIMVMSVAMRAYTDRAGVLKPGTPRESMRRYVVVMGVFLVSIPVALLVDASAGIWTWTALGVDGLLLRLRRVWPP
jgi:uncharacterized membrane protein